VIQTIKRLSKPGRRMYAGSRELKPVLGGLGIRIISTSKGVISDREARRDKVGGELICEVA
jgi:small subunit ribosomal protein S8